MLRKILVTTGLILLWALAVVGVVLTEAAWFGHPAVERGNLVSIENHLTQNLQDAVENKRLGSAGLVLVQLPHDWVYWETGKMTYDAKRQVFYDRMKGFGLVALIFGAVAIVLWKAFGDKPAKERRF